MNGKDNDSSLIALILSSTLILLKYSHWTAHSSSSSSPVHTQDACCIKVKLGPQVKAQWEHTEISESSHTRLSGMLAIFKQAGQPNAAS